MSAYNYNFIVEESKKLRVLDGGKNNREEKDECKRFFRGVYAYKELLLGAK